MGGFRTRRNVLTVLMASVMTASLSGCGSSSSPATTASNETKASGETGEEAKAATEGRTEDVIIRMWAFLDPTDKEDGRSVALRQMIDEFEAENPGIKVVMEPQDWTTATGKFLAVSATGDTSDIMWYARDEMYGVLNADALEPLENLFLGDWNVEEVAGVDDVFFQFGKRDGKHYTLTLNKNYTGLFYWEDLLKEVGFQVSETFEELYDPAKALAGTDASDIQRCRLGMSFFTKANNAQAIVNWLLQENGDLFNVDGAANWASSAGVKGVNWMKGCIDTDVTSAESVNTTIEDIYTGFTAGKYAMAIASATHLASLRSAASFDGNTIRFTTLPGGTIIDGWPVGVWSGSRHREEAGKSVEKVYSPESDMRWIELGGRALCRKSAVESLETTDEDKYIKAVIRVFGEGQLPSNTEVYIGQKLGLNYPIQNVLTEDMKPMAVLKNAEEIFNIDNNH